MGDVRSMYTEKIGEYTYIIGIYVKGVKLEAINELIEQCVNTKIAHPYIKKKDDGFKVYLKFISDEEIFCVSNIMYKFAQYLQIIEKDSKDILFEESNEGDDMNV